MSSLAAVQADGFYHPPEWDPRKESLRKFTGSKGHNQYLQSGVIRFEMPYHVWCLKCESHIGKGVRFNAKKIEAGKYFSTKIWEFQMKCATCKALLVIRTDPKNCDYQMVEGLRRKEQGYDEEDIGLKPLPTESTSTAVSVDPIMALERSGDEKRKAEKESEYLNRLIEHKRATEQDNYGANALLRRSMRSQKRARDAVTQESRAKGVGYDLLPASTKDAEEASTFSFSESRHENFRKSAKAKIASIMGSSIFGDSYKGGSSSSSASGRELVPAGKKVELLSKHSSRASANKDLAVKRAKQGIDVKQFVMDDCVDGASGLLVRPAIRRRVA